MALSKRNVDKAFEILMEVGNLKAPFMDEYQPGSDNEFRTGIILVYGQVQDGWENVFMHLYNITDKQLSIFERRKKEVHNTSICDQLENGITRIGWF